MLRERAVHEGNHREKGCGIIEGLKDLDLTQPRDPQHARLHSVRDYVQTWKVRGISARRAADSDAEE